MLCNEQHHIILHSDTKEFEEAYLTSLQGGFSLNDRSQPTWTLLWAYSKRMLTYESDMLNAFSGVLNHALRYHLWGLPIQSRRLELYLHWQLYDSLRKIKRRSGFPTWSWVGWKGRINPCRSATPNRLTITVEVPGKQKPWQTLREYKRNDYGGRKSSPMDQPRFLRITAPRLFPKFSTKMKLASHMSPKIRATFEFDCVLDPYGKVNLEDDTVKTQLEDLWALAVYCGTYATNNYRGDALMVLLLKSTRHRFRRVGIISLRIKAGKIPRWLTKAEMATVVLE